MARLQDNVAHNDRDKEKITAIYCLWMVDNKRGESGRVSGQKTPRQNPPEINPRTKTPQRKLMNTKYILHK